MPVEPIRGRGTSTNPPNRFERIEYEVDIDVEPHPDAGSDETPRPRTEFYRDVSKTIISRNESPDVGFDASINPYRGCEHGCVYCYARPFHEYLGMSAGLDFETRIMVKEDAPKLLYAELLSPKWVPKVIGISGVTDAYQPIERQLGLTRQCLEVLLEFRNPAVIITKNRLVTRDIDVLSELSRLTGTTVFISVTTLDLDLNRILEPRTSSPAQRLDAISKLARAGVNVGALVAPIIPGLTDEEVPAILSAVAKAGARQASYVMLRLPHAVAPLFERWLGEHYPDRKDKILNRVRSMRGGELYKSGFEQRMRGEGFHAEQIKALFRVSCTKAGLNRADWKFDASQFRRPREPNEQLGLFS